MCLHIARRIFFTVGIGDRSTGQPHDGGITTTGHVTGFSNDKNDEGSKTSIEYPLVAFETYSGATVEFRDSCGSRDRQPAVGSAVRVSYNPSNPKDATNLEQWTKTRLAADQHQIIQQARPNLILQVFFVMQMGSRAAYRCTGMSAPQRVLHVQAGTSRCTKCRTHESVNVHPG